MGHKFWIVWNPEGQGQPTHRHASQESAELEAQRLAHSLRTHRFYVLEAVSVAYQPTVVNLETLTPAPPEEQAQEPKAIIAGDRDPFADE